MSAEEIYSHWAIASVSKRSEGQAVEWSDRAQDAHGGGGCSVGRVRNLVARAYSIGEEAAGGGLLLKAVARGLCVLRMLTAGRTEEELEIFKIEEERVSRVICLQHYHVSPFIPRYLPEHLFA